MSTADFETAIKKLDLPGGGNLTSALVEAYGRVFSELREALKSMVTQALPEYKNLEWRLDIDVTQGVPT